MGELAMAAVDLPPLMEQGDDRRGLVGEQPMHRQPGAAVGQCPGRPPAQPAVGPQLGQVEDMAGPPQRPARRPRFLQQIEQRRLRGRVDAAWDPAT